jgi:hypothetical protein
LFDVILCELVAVVPAPPATASAEPALNDLGAYAALANLPDANKLNRRAVVVISNNDLGLSCNGAPTPSVEAAAKTAFDTKGISTYVIELGQEGQTDAGNVDQEKRRVSCEAVARAGSGGRIGCFNAGSGTQEEAGIQAGRALSTIVADLSSCLYVRPASVADASTAKISIVAGPIGFLDVKFDDKCTPATSADVPGAADGWNFDGDGSLIRICGKTCTTIRDTLLASTAAATAANGGNVSAPLNRQPVFVTAILDKK